MTPGSKAGGGQAQEAAATRPEATDPHIAQPPVLSLKQQREAMKEGHLIGFHCAACKVDRLSPMLRCPKCGSTAITRREFSRTGKVVSFTIQAVASEAFLNETPFAFALVQLDDGPRVSGWIPWIAKEKDLPLDQKVEFTPSYKPGYLFEKK